MSKTILFNVLTVLKKKRVLTTSENYCKYIDHRQHGTKSKDHSVNSNKENFPDFPDFIIKKRKKKKKKRQKEASDGI